MLKIRRPLGRLIFNMGIAIPGKTVFLIETAPCFLVSTTNNTLELLRMITMTSSNGNIFRDTGHLCREFTCHRWIPLTKASDAQLWCFLQCLNKQRVLMHGHQGWNVRHGLCHIYMIYVKMWVVYSFCLFCCLFIIVTTQFVALYKPCKPKPKFR